jgi:hypothetical protein
MRIPRFWAPGRCKGRFPDANEPTTFFAWGWSFDSLSGAEDDALARARRIAERIGLGEERATYGYFDRPIREEIKESLVCNGEEHGLITRNQYGALVLNSSRVLFADVDFPAVIPRGFWDALRIQFSRTYRQSRQQALEQAVWNRVRRWTEANAGRGFRLYRTARGMRLLMTDRRYDPAGREATLLLEELGSDPLYRKLTEVQQCFRARLTAKPWRCGWRNPPHRFPFADTEVERRFRQWEREYTGIAERYRACELIGEQASGAADEVIEQTVRVHDERACLPEGAPLA